MRELKEEELEKIKSKLMQYIGNNFNSFLNPLYKLVLHNQRIYYVSNELYKRASSISKDNLVCIGTCIGRFTRSDYFKIKITALHVLMTYATHKVKVKNTAEMNVLYGNHVQRSHLGGLPTEIKKNTGVLLTTTYGVPLGFGIMSKPATEIVSGDRTANIVLRHADTGEYLREEGALM
ncbi:60S ribosome subunit biogenesis protein NIP7 [Nematocida sp. AWRm80]|nr:60S ribosome subunit biogenesis protein NIP7 [Nematocida sp. AWRm80]